MSNLTSEVIFRAQGDSYATGFSLVTNCFERKVHFYEKKKPVQATVNRRHTQASPAQTTTNHGNARHQNAFDNPTDLKPSLGLAHACSNFPRLFRLQQFELMVRQFVFVDIRNFLLLGAKKFW